MEFSDSEAAGKQPGPAAHALISIGDIKGGRSSAWESRGKTEQHCSFENWFQKQPNDSLSLYIQQIPTPILT